MRLLLMADGIVGSQIAAWLLEHHRDDLALVVTRSEGSILEAAGAAGVPTTLYQSDKQVVSEVRGAGGSIDLGVLAWWPTLIREPLLSAPAVGFVNTHPSLLPYNRGKHYNFWAIVEQAPFGVSLHRVSAAVDAGDVVAQLPIAYGWEDTGQTLYEKAGAAVVRLFRDTYPALRTLDFESRAQPPGDGSFHRASELEEASQIDLDGTYTGRDLLNLLRARTFPPHPACWFTDDGATYDVRVSISPRRP